MLEVYLTIDTECSMGGAWDTPQAEPVPPERAILGRIGTQFYGTPLIMDILEQHGLRGTFFIEMLATHVVPEQQLADAYGEIVRRGHDPQLHLHPVYHYHRLFRRKAISREQLPPRMDLIGSLPLEMQLQLLEEGSRLFHQFAGRAPLAFRAGCFGGSSSTLAALSKLGLRYDSSFNAAFLGSSCLMDSHRPINTPWHDNGVWEVPVTNFETGLWKMRGFKPLDIGAVSLPEMKRVLEEAERLEMRTVVFLMHSFTLFKKADPQFRSLRPDRLVIRRFRELCKFLGESSGRLKVVTFADKPDFSSASRPSAVPRVGALLSSCRKVIQGVNRAYWI
jgi:hypothetical protein